MISSKILIPVVIGVACVLALVIGTNLAVDSEMTMVVTCMVALVFILIVFARDFWWLSLFLAVAFGGYAYFGFKIYAHEVLLCVALAGLLPSLAINPVSPYSKSRPKLPWLLWVTGAYLVFGIFYSISLHDPRGFIELGGIGRAYINGLWPLLFIFLFRLYGGTHRLVMALYCLQALYLLRAIMTLLTLYFPLAMVLPGINFILPGSENGGGGLDDLRHPGHAICLLSCAFLLSRPYLPVKSWHITMFFFSVVALLLGGGRGLTIASMLAIVAAMLTARMWKTAIAGAVFGGSLILLLNIFPQSLNGLDNRSQRVLSVLVFDQEATNARFQILGSNVWHDRLAEIGYDRWTESTRTILLGTGIIPWQPKLTKGDTWQEQVDGFLQGAANTGNYESGLWGILTPTGLIGFLLYLSVLGYFSSYCLRRILSGKLAGTDLTVAFLGAYPAIEWVILCPRQGGYPTLELLYAVTAYYFLHDRSSRGIFAESDDTSTYAESRES